MAGSAQNTENKNQPDEKKNTVYISFGGPGIYFSANYERHIISRKAYQLGIKAGIGSSFSTVLFPYEFSIPAGVFYLYGKRNHHLDLSAGVTAYLLDQYDYSEDRSYKEAKFLVVPSVAYRYQKPSGGLITRIGISPVININQVTNSFSPWIDASVGWAF